MFGKKEYLEAYKYVYDKSMNLCDKYREVCIENAALKHLILSDSFDKALSFIEVDEVEYIIFLQNKKDIGNCFSAEFVISKTQGCYSSPVVIANVEIQTSSIEIIFLYTEKHYRRKGLASYCIKQIAIYAAKHNKKKIYGMVHENTEIGRGNLIEFYCFNGFELYTKSDGSLWFKKYIDSRV